MKDEPRRRRAIDILAAALKEEAKLVTVELMDDGLGLRVDWPGNHHTMVIRTKRIKTVDDWELWLVEPPGHPLALTSDIRGAVTIVRDLSGDRVR